jgi:alpha-tubulin suppressor-like RCC1 family protein
VAAGSAFACAIKSDASLVCWGNSSLAQTVPAGTFAQASLSGGFGCAVRTDGTLACWGDNTDGEATPPSGTFSRVSTGNAHACAIRTDGSLACWGDNFFDQTFAPLTGSYVQIKATANRTCAVRG